MTLPNVLRFLVALAIPQAAGLIGALFTTAAISGWYATLIKPELAPPNWIFGPVWTTLFLLMGIATFLVWKRGFARADVRVALIVFWAHLVLNTLWSIIFFGLQNPGAALIEIVVLWFSIVGAMILFARVSPAAAWLLAPYLAWVSFASYLNYMIWTLN